MVVSSDPGLPAGRDEPAGSDSTSPSLVSDSKQTQARRGKTVHGELANAGIVIDDEKACGQVHVMGGLQHPGGVGRERIHDIARLQQLRVRRALWILGNRNGGSDATRNARLMRP